jgi:hypothetical protein
MFNKVFPGDHGEPGNRSDDMAFAKGRHRLTKFVTFLGSMAERGGGIGKAKTPPGDGRGLEGSADPRGHGAPAD